MIGLKGAFIFPHPPIIIPEVGKGNETDARNTVAAALEASGRIAELKPDTILVITPHGNMLSDAITLSGDPVLYGSFANFGAPQIKLELKNDLELVREIIKNAEQSGIIATTLDEEVRRTYRFADEIDHGTLVPLYFIHKKHPDFKLVHITYSMLSNEEHYRFGMDIRKAIENLNRNTVVICSGDLSHRLSKDAPAGYSPKGAVYDKEFLDIIKQGDVHRLLNMDCRLLESAGECAFRSAVITYGILDGCSPKAEILSYEGPFGVGYCVAQLHLDCKSSVDCKSEILDAYINERKNMLKEIRSGEDAYTALARHTLEGYIKEGAAPELPVDLPIEMLDNKAGVFVSIKKNGDLRGCIGTISPTTGSVAEEIIQNAVSAGTRDPRFYPVEKEELEELQYSVDVLGEPEPIESKEQLDVKRYGVIVRKGHKSGLLLPNLEGVETIVEQLEIALQKAGIPKGESYKMERFEVTRHK